MTERFSDSPEARFVGLMSELFQLREAEELDFGIYRVIKRHNQHVREFLGEIVEEQGQPVLRGGELAGILEQAFSTIENATRQEKKIELQRLAEALGVKAHFAADERERYLAGVEQIPAMRQQVMDYRNLREELETTYSASADRSEVLNRLYEFFSRHYQDGDFIVQRRYGRNGARYIKSSGEDTEFHWATEDLYYIKSGDVFTDYPVRLSNDRRLLFCVDAETLQQTRAELKPTDKASYKLRAIVQDPPRPLGEGSLDSPRPLGEGPGERASFRVILDYVKGVQKARAQLEEIVTQAAVLTQAPPEEIARHLRRYVARNQSDFFIHQRLQEALDDDLDIFVKTDVLNAEQLLADDAGQLPARALRVARVIRNVGRRINAFLGVLEDFQKRLWEKKKLVLFTRYVITLDRLATLAGREFVEANLAAILGNAAQIAEWQALGLGELATAEAVRRQDSGFLPLPIDTLHFDEDFKWALLAAVTKEYPLDESLDGVAIHSDNWQALNTMQEKYGERVQAVYADPPYNTDAGPISYKNGYRHSSWLALMEHRLTKSKKLLEEKGIFCITIDDSEFHRLRCLSEACLSDFDILGVAAIKNNPAGRTTTSGFSVCHEYAVFLGREGVSEVNRLEHSQSQKDRYKEQDEIGFFEWTNFRKHGGVNTYKTTRPRQFYPIYIKGEEIRFPMMEWNEKQRNWDIQEAPSTDEEVIWPIDEKGKERIWDFGAETAKNNISHLKIRQDSKGKTAIYRKWRINDEGLLPQTWWDKSLYSAVEHGTNLLSRFFGETHVFMFPKSIHAVEDCIRVAGMRNNANGIVLDFFAGSGTVGHATINLNRTDGGCRQFILVETNSYINEVTIPRLKKVTAANEWNIGFPAELNGPGLFMRVQRLEQYEDTLENLAVAAGENQSLFTGPEALAYELDAEAKRLLFANSAFTAPFNLTLKRTVGAGVETGPVDLVESLIYLLGLHVERLYREQGSVILTGALNHSRQTAAIFWRDNVLHGADWLQTKMAEHPADRYYTNDPARLSFPGVERFAAIETVFVDGMA